MEAVREHMLQVEVHNLCNAYNVYNACLHQTSKPEMLIDLMG